MRLDLASFNVECARFGEGTALDGRELIVDITEIRNLVLSDDIFDDVKIHLAHPNDQVRVIHVIDAVEPRYKVSGTGQVFPGVLGPPSQVGEGLTHRLNGMVVLTACEPVPGEPIHWREAIVDMWGTGAQYSPFSQKINLVLDLKAHKPPEQGTESSNTIMGSEYSRLYNRSVRAAGFRVASYLAGKTAHLIPDQVESFELTPVSKGLPKMFYASEESRQYLYGATMGWQPTLMHPNEYADGAIYRSFNGPASIREASYFYQNHPIVASMYNRHGKDIDFGGVLLYPWGGESMEEKERITSFAANLLRQMRAEGVVITFIGGGHPGIDPMMLCQKCEQMGIKTTLLYPEMAANPSDPGFVHFVPEADAVVSVGNYEEPITLPSAPRVIGGNTVLLTQLNAYDQLPLTVRYIFGASSPLGDWNLTGIQY